LDTPTQKTLDAIKEEIQYGPEDFEELYKDKVYLVSLRSPVFKDNVTSFVDKHMSEWFEVRSAPPPRTETEPKILMAERQIAKSQMAGTTRATITPSAR
jgi:hypothetical protein